MRRLYLATFLTIGLASAASAAPITYNIQSYSSLQNGFSLSGTITTDGTIGNISAANITSWAFTATKGPTTFSGSSSNPGANLLVEGTLTATSTQLTIPVPAAGTFSRLAFDVNLFGDFFDALVWTREARVGPFSMSDSFSSSGNNFPNPPLWSNASPVGTLPLPTSGAPFIIAAAPGVSAVPEPGTITLALIMGIGGLFGIRLVRRGTTVES